MTQRYPGGVTKNELEIRLRALRDEIRRVSGKDTRPASAQLIQRITTSLETMQYSALQGVPQQFPPEPHLHTQDEIIDLNTYTVEEVDALIAALEVGAHEGYLHMQILPSDTWVIEHGMGRYPAVTVMTSGGTEVIGSVTHTSVNSLTITFSVAFSGKAQLV